MNKSLYSLILSDDVVRQVDKRALEQGTSRSNLINQVLAQYVSLVTPEKRIGDIFAAVEGLMRAWDGGIIPSVTPHQSTMQLKSSLEYKYRPTVKYDVELYKTFNENVIGKISINFRTQSSSLLEKMNEFFHAWVCAERNCKNEKPEYALYDGKFTRSITLIEEKEYSSEQISKGISNFVRVFDSLMKGFLNGKYSKEDVERLYNKYFMKGLITI